MSEEMVNRACLAPLALVLAAATPQPLVVGTVRDQHGLPVVAAVVTIQAAAGPVQVRTGPDGTFAAATPGGRAVTITCRFCRPAEAPVSKDGTVTAIVLRYDALADPSPSSDDYASLPFSRAESTLSLTPFTILETSTRALPGPQVSFGALSPGGGSLIDAGVHNYDIVSGISPWLAIPLRYAQDAGVANPLVGLVYGDRAGSGTFLADPYANGSDATAIGGSDAIGRVGIAAAPQHLSLGYSSAGDDRRERVDAQIGSNVTSGATWAIAGLSEEGTQDADDRSLSSSFSAARLSYRSAGSEQFALDATLDRGSYAFDYPQGATASAWSDATATGLAEPASGRGMFAALSAQIASGSYAASSIAGIAAHTDRVSSVVGLHSAGDSYDVTAAVAGYHVGYAGPYENQTSAASLVAPLFRLEVTPASLPLSLTVSASGGFSTPTLLQQYAFASRGALVLDRNETYQVDLSYSDGARVVTTVQALTQTVAGFDNGYVNGFGGSLAWQLTPELSLRAWWMHAGFDETSATATPVRGAHPQPSNVASAWLSYQSAGGIRVDTIWRRDLVDWQPTSQLAGSVSGPLARHLRWFAGTEKVQGARSVEAGARFAL